MIILIEPQCVGWQHESVNAGFIESIKRNIGKEQVKIYAEKEHICCLRQLLPDIEKEIFFQAINIPRKKLDWATPFPLYYRLFRKILCSADNVNARAVFLLSCNKGNLVAIRKIAESLKQINFYIVIHAIAEQLINKGKIPRHTFISLKYILETFSGNKNATFITYSPVAKEVLSDYLKREILDKILFLHHPFPLLEQDVQDANEDGKVHIAILGAAARRDVYDFIKSIDQEIAGKIVFNIMSRRQIDFSDLKSARILKRDGNITNTEIALMIGKSQFVFLPYTRKEYQVSCSGVLIDAIRQAVPILAFDSSLLVWYNQHNIGKVFKTRDEMREYLMELRDGGCELWLTYRQNMIDLRLKIINENDNKISEICQGGYSSE